MTNWTSAKDPISNVPSRVSFLGAQSFAGQIPLFAESCIGSTLDEIARWTVGGTSGGTVELGSGEILLTAPDTGDEISITSKNAHPLIAGGELVLSATLRMGSAAEIGNTRRFGLWADASNYMMFVLEDSLWCCRVWEGGQEFDNDVTISAPAASANSYMNLQIRATKSRVLFLADDTLVGTFTSRGAQIPLSAAGLFYVVLDNINGSPAETTNTMFLNELTLTRTFETWPGQPMVATCAGSTDTLVAYGPVFYCGMTGGTASSDVTVYDTADAITAADRIVDYFDGTIRLPGSGAVMCNEGITIDNQTATPIYVHFVLA